MVPKRFQLAAPLIYWAIHHNSPLGPQSYTVCMGLQIFHEDSVATLAGLCYLATLAYSLGTGIWV